MEGGGGGIEESCRSNDAINAWSIKRLGPDIKLCGLKHTHFSRSLLMLPSVPATFGSRTTCCGNILSSVKNL